MLRKLVFITLIFIMACVSDKGKEQKTEIAEIRTETKAAIADKDVSLDYKIRKLADRIPPERLESEKEILKKEFNDIKEKLEEEMEKKIEEIQN